MKKLLTALLFFVIALFDSVYAQKLSLAELKTGMLIPTFAELKIDNKILGMLKGKKFYVTFGFNPSSIKANTSKIVLAMEANEVAPDPVSFFIWFVRPYTFLYGDFDGSCGKTELPYQMSKICEETWIYCNYVRDYDAVTKEVLKYIYFEW